MKTLRHLSLPSSLLAMCLAVSLFAWGVEPSQVYHQLAMKDLDEVTAHVKERIKASRAENADRNEILKATLFTVFARPDEDGMIDKVVGPLRSEIDEHASWEQFVRDLVNDSVRILLDPQGKKGAEQVTHAIFLQNIVATLKPAARRGGWEQQVLRKIAQADIRLTKASRDERKLRLMKDTQSPSAMAQQALGPAKGPENLDDDDDESADASSTDKK